MFTFKHYVDDRGLVSYGDVFPPMWRRTADYVARILTGAKPADLPIEQHTKFELLVDPKDRQGTWHHYPKRDALGR